MRCRPFHDKVIYVNACFAGGIASSVPPDQALRWGAGNLQTVMMSEQEQADTRLEFARLKQEHADFDAAINAMIATSCDPLQIQRMKKKKLAIKDRLKALEDRIIPDIIA
jgi:hypothetical protein